MLVHHLDASIRPKSQPIGLVWGVARQRAARLWYKGRTLAMALKHLRFGFYGGVPGLGMGRWATTDVAGCARTAYGEMDKWIRGDLERNAGGLMGTIDNLDGWENWTETAMPCLAVVDLDVDRDTGATPVLLSADAQCTLSRGGSRIFVENPSLMNIPPIFDDF